MDVCGSADLLRPLKARLRGARAADPRWPKGRAKERSVHHARHSAYPTFVCFEPASRGRPTFLVRIPSLDHHPRGVLPLSALHTLDKRFALVSRSLPAQDDRRRGGRLFFAPVSVGSVYFFFIFLFFYTFSPVQSTRPLLDRVVSADELLIRTTASRLQGLLGPKARPLLSRCTTGRSTGREQVTTLLPIVCDAVGSPTEWTSTPPHLPYRARQAR